MIAARRLILLAALPALVAVACAGDDADSSGATTLPPGMTQGGTRTNADLPPPAIPFSASTPVVQATVLQRFPHDTGAYTQGLLLAGTRVLESTGRYGQSDVRETALASGTIVRRTRMGDQYFADGLARANVYQTDVIARLEPRTGAVKGYVGIAGILTPEQRADVGRRGGTSNGIGYDAPSGRLLVTGKLWPVIAQIRKP